MNWGEGHKHSLHCKDCVHCFSHFLNIVLFVFPDDSGIPSESLLRVSLVLHNKLFRNWAKLLMAFRYYVTWKVFGDCCVNPHHTLVFLGFAS